MIIFNDSNYYIKRSKRGYVAINVNGDYNNHSHFKNIGPAKQCIYLTKNRIIPKSDYMMEACIRLSTEEGYINKIQELKDIKRNKQKIKYRNKKFKHGYA